MHRALGRDDGRRMIPSTAGLVLLDTQDRVVYHTPEAIKILTYSRSLKTYTSDSLYQALQPLLRPRKSSGSQESSPEFTSGRRRYTCRFFTLAHCSGNAAQAARGILLERAAARLVDVSSAAQQFGLTQREQETVELLTLGLTSKEIAVRMNISPNTVKAFFRMVMTKMSVSTRSGIVGKIARITPLG